MKNLGKARRRDSRGLRPGYVPQDPPLDVWVSPDGEVYPVPQGQAHEQVASQLQDRGLMPVVELARVPDGLSYLSEGALAGWLRVAWAPATSKLLAEFDDRQLTSRQLDAMFELAQAHRAAGRGRARSTSARWTQAALAWLADPQCTGYDPARVWEGNPAAGEVAVPLPDPQAPAAAQFANYWISPGGEVYGVRLAWGHEAAARELVQRGVMAGVDEAVTARYASAGVLAGWLRVAQPGDVVRFDYFEGYLTQAQLDAVFDLAQAHRSASAGWGWRACWARSAAAWLQAPRPSGECPRENPVQGWAVGLCASAWLSPEGVLAPAGLAGHETVAERLAGEQGYVEGEPEYRRWGGQLLRRGWVKVLPSGVEYEQELTPRQLDTLFELSAELTWLHRYPRLRAHLASVLNLEPGEEFEENPLDRTPAKALKLARQALWLMTQGTGSAEQRLYAKFYAKAQRAADAVARQQRVSAQVVWEALMAAARREGPLAPRPGKDY